jgi:hypothetical protein
MEVQGKEKDQSHQTQTQTHSTCTFMPELATQAISKVAAHDKLP